MDFTRHFVSMYHQDRVFKRRPATIDATETSSIEEIEIDDSEISEQGAKFIEYEKQKFTILTKSHEKGKFRYFHIVVANTA